MDYKSDINFHVFPHAIQFYFHSQVQINLLLRKSEQQPHSRHEKWKFIIQIFIVIYCYILDCDVRQIDSIN